MIEYTQKHLVRPGMMLKATGFNGNAENVSEGGVYEVVEVVEGIFSSRPYVVVRLADGGKAMWHLSRFSFITTNTPTSERTHHA